MKNIIIVTGGAGFVGTNLISLLVKKTKFNIISIDNYSSGSKKNHIKNKKILIKYDTKKPNGTPRKVLDINLAKSYGWTPKTKLSDAILKTYLDFLKVKK